MANKSGPCYKMGRDAYAALSKEEKLAIHKDRMARKDLRRAEDRFNAFFAKQIARGARIPPNLSKKHPNKHKPIKEAYNGTRG